MKNETQRKKLFAVTAGVIGVILLICAAVIFSKYTLVGGHFYARNRYVYDLRGQGITEKNFRKLHKRLPDSWILWDVEFQGNTYDSDTAELAVFTLTDEDVDRLDYFPQLKVLHAEGCEDLPQLMEVQARHPDCKVYYNVEIGGKLYDQDTTRLELTDLSEEDALRLEYLPNLKKVDASRCYAYDLLESLKQSHPEWNLSYAIRVGDGEFTRSAKRIAATGGTYGELWGAMTALKDLKTVLITDPQASSDELRKLREEFPEVNLQWEMTVFDSVVPCTATELDLSGHILSGTEEAETLAAYFPDLEKLIMSDCGIDNETMADFREKMRPEYKVVWTVYFTPKCKARTDDITFMPIKQGEYHFNDTHTANLKYLEDMVCMDIGHAPVKNIEFLKYMPKLKYLILAWTDVRDLTPISNCKELIFLELDNTPSYHDYSPLVELTKLEDLNLGCTYNDWRPIMQMTWLKHLWWTERKDAYVIENALKEVMPDCVMEFHAGYTVGGGWRKLPNYYAMRDMLGMPYMD